MTTQTGTAKAGMSRIQEKNRARILEAALGEFSRFGYAGTTIEQISKAAGMSKSNLLYYFASKDAIYAAVMDQILDGWLNPLRTLDRDGDPAIELRVYIRQKLEMSAKSPDSSRLFANEVMQGAPQIKQALEQDLKKIVAEKSDVIQHWIEAGKIRKVSPVHLLFMIWATTQHYADFSAQITAVTGKGLEDRTFFDETEVAISGIILHGLGLELPASEA